MPAMGTGKRAGNGQGAEGGASWRPIEVLLVHKRSVQKLKLSCSIIRRTALLDANKPP